MDGMNIQEHGNKFSRNVSGGTKRKASIITFCGIRMIN